MRWSLCIVVGLALACGAGASGPPSWSRAEVARESNDGWSPEVGGFRLQLAKAVRTADGNLQFLIVAHATPAARRRLGAGEKISLHLSDERGVQTTWAGPVPLGGGWTGGKTQHSWHWGGAPATMVYAHVEWTNRGLKTKRLRIRLPPK
jgi:hypothetical protein